MGGSRKPVPKIQSNVRPSPKPPNRRVPEKLAIAASVSTVGIALLKGADPDAWVAVGLQPPWMLLVEHPVASGTATGCSALAVLCGVFRERLLRRVVKPLVQEKFGHLDPSAAEKEFPLYPDLIRVDLPMLRMSARELARRTGLPFYAAWYISRNPRFFPRPEVIQRICEALLTPPERLRTGGDYGSDCTLRRLLRLHESGRAVGWTKEKILEADLQQRSSLLSRIQRRLRKELDSTANGGNHE
jgi:transcriptional regulator with XRE-family HTH domain